MKLDKDGSGSIDKDEFLQIPQIANNPLAHRMIAIFDEEWVRSSELRLSYFSWSRTRETYTKESIADWGVVGVGASTSRNSLVV